MKSTTVCLALTSLCLLAFQNCSAGFRTNKLSSSSLVHTISTSGSLFSAQSINDLGDNDPIDLAPFFSSAKVPESQSRFNLFEEAGESDGNKIVVNSKFNQLNNFEIFVVTPSAILIRYEVSPEIYGGDQNAVRRFRDIPVRPEDIRGATALPVNGDNGAMWFKRIVTKAEIGKTFVSAQAIDHTVYTHPDTLGALSGSYWPMYNWFEFTQNTLHLPFVNSGESILRLYSQWSSCSTEVYEYAAGVGMTAWRALESSSATCQRNLDKSKPSVVLFNNFTGVNERFYIVAGDVYDGVFANTVYSNRVVQNYSPGGNFVDDFTYQFTSANMNMLNHLRPAQPDKPTGPTTVITTTTTTTTPAQSSSTVLQSYYEMYLGRTPASSEISYWADLINAGVFSIEQARQQIQNSQEAIIRGFYLTYLQKEPDYPGLTYWRQKNTEGLSYESIRNYFRTDSACRAQCL